MKEGPMAGPFTRKQYILGSFRGFCGQQDHDLESRTCTAENSTSGQPTYKESEIEKNEIDIDETR
ncbi:unnamed protein product, partial [Nesidiocoris tenuis]